MQNQNLTPIERFLTMFSRLDGLVFRISVYGSAYAAFAAFVAITGVYNFGSAFGYEIYTPISVLVTLYILYQMLTSASRGGTIAFVAALGATLLGPFLDLLGVT
jgi:hypothetical protein